MNPEPLQEVPSAGRPRDPSIEDRVFEAAKQELAERGFEAFSVRSVARRANVARPSLLLRWPSRDALIMETLEKLIEWPRPDDSASVRSEVEAIVAHVAVTLEPVMMGIQLRLIADAPRHPELFAMFQDKVMAKAGLRLTKLLDRAVEEGELPTGTDKSLAADALIGVMFMRTIRSHKRQPPTPAAQRRVIDAIWNWLTKPG